ncbi:RTA1 like protein-domain-containing protein [Papiliotrema laurentii]|uniref:RTA1 like protein-domain-containing protein n=1 Tax=Papiliotrema laurentii TaxID=5418 RepID=A0AAD9FPS7_PAPLA|nr:RTA1 like protein-domain-containing protein [Papiliotrema laurentii]
MPTFTDPETGKTLITGYVPSYALSVVGIATYGALALVFWIWMLRRFRKWMLALTIGCTTMALGFVIRIPMHNSPDSLGIYIMQYMLILLSPCAFLAQDYVILPRIATWLNAEDCLFLESRWIVRTFVWADVTTFLLQAAGGGMTAAQGDSMANIGHWVAIVGLVVQLAFFLTFCSLALTFAFRVKKKYPWKWSRSVAQTQVNGSASFVHLSWKEDWRVLYGALMWTTIGIIVRSIFRIIEFAQGYDGNLRTVEWYFYAFDALPVLLAIAVYAVIWPPNYLVEGTSPFSGSGPWEGPNYPMSRVNVRGSPDSVEAPFATKG